MWPMSYWKSNTIPSFAQGLHVLLIDHIIASLTCMAGMLQHHSYKVTSTQIASVALSMIAEPNYEFDLVIANADMPNMNIFSFRRQLRKDIPIIMTSSTKDRKVAMKSLAEGASFFLMKPILKDDIKYLWQHVYRNRKAMGDLTVKKLMDGKRALDDGSGEEDMEVGEGGNAEEGESKSKRIKMRSHTNLESTKWTEGEGNSLGTSNNSTRKKRRIVWSQDLRRKFIDVLSQLDESRAQPKTILQMMDHPSLTRRQVSNHLQKYKAKVQLKNMRDRRQRPRIQSSPTGVQSQQVNSSNYPPLPGLYAANMENFGLRGTNTISGNQRYSYGSHSNMVIQHRPEEYAEKQSHEIDENDDFLTYLNLEHEMFQDPNAVVEKANVTRGGSSSDCYLDQIQALKQYADLIRVLEEDNNGEQNFSEVDRYCEWLREDLFGEDKGPSHGSSRV